MGRRLIERKTCEACGQRIDVTDDGVEHGHVGHAGVAGATEASLPAAPPVEEAGPVATVTDLSDSAPPGP
jgi:hypothetical protein